MPNDEQPRQSMLNVIFHGSFVFVDRGDEIHVRIPNLPQHAITAGNWLGETKLMPGTYRLDGVVHGKAGFNAERNLILHYKELPSEPAPYATIVFPKPAGIQSLRVAPLPKDSLEAVDAKDSHAQKEVQRLNAAEHRIATMQVFTYAIDNVKRLALSSAPKGKPDPSVVDGHYWEPVVVPGKDHTDFANLHIYSTEDHYQDPFQAEDFAQCAATMGVKLKLRNPYQASRIPEQSFALPEERLPPGVNARETEDLAARTKRMARLGRLACLTEGDTNDAWFEDDALDDATMECGPLVGIQE